MALNILVLHEWESVPRPVRPMPAGSHHSFDYLALGTREYGARFGLPRLLDVLDRHGVGASIIVSGLVAELFPETVREAKERGHEIALHQWDQAIHPPVFKSMEEERESLIRTIEAVQKITGERARGYMSQGPRPTPNTLEIIADLGFAWTCDYSDSDVPYIVEIGDKKVVSIGYVTPGYTDNDVAPLGLAGALNQLKDEFDAVYEESARHPMRMCYAVHVHRSGRPGMARVLDRFLEHALSHEGVWVSRGIEVAEFWLGQKAEDRR
jgi:peptidoglycan/xylan/chitin deacetylase (PgdA/CDA1 family)